MQTSFHEKVVAEIKRIPSSPTLDVALLKLPLADAVQIDANAELERVAREQRNVGTVTFIDFAEIIDAFPPIPDRNLFVEFHSSSWGYAANMPLERAGLHIVPLEQAQTSVLFSKLPPPPKNLKKCVKTYAVTAYLERPKRVDIHSVGTIIGLDQKGGVVEHWPFPTSGKFPTNVNEEWQTQVEQIGLLVYLVFSCFMMVNQREAIMREVSPGQWVV